MRIQDILAQLGEEAVIEIPDGETPESVAVIVKTVDADGKKHLRNGGTSRWTPAGRVKAQQESDELLRRILSERAP